MNDKIYTSFQQNFYPQRLELKHNSVNIDFVGNYSKQVCTGLQVELSMDGQKFNELATALYEIEADTIVRKNNPTVMKAYEQYKILLELART